MGDFLSRFEFPESCRVGQRIAKTLFGESAAFTAGDRRMFSQDVEEARCAFVLDAAKTQISPIEDATRDYTCFAVIEIDLRNGAHAPVLAELCHRAMPYPLLVVLSDADGKVRLSMAEKRQSKDGKETTVLERVVTTSWREPASFADFFAASSFAPAAKRDFAALHRFYFERLEALNAAEVTGRFRPECRDPEARRVALDGIRRIDLELGELKRRIKPALALAELIDLNVKIKSLERTRAGQIQRL